MRVSRDGRITANRVRELLDYDPLTGVFVWKVHKGGGAPSNGDPAGSRMSSGQINLGIDGTRYLAHRIAWLHYYGVWPTKIIDHINGDNSDNRIANLREASHVVNGLNAKRKKNATTKYCGVDFHKRRQQWRSRLSGNHLGWFPNEEQAYAAYLAQLRKISSRYPLAAHPSFTEL